jgi:hypothetical protein
MPKRTQRRREAPAKGSNFNEHDTQEAHAEGFAGGGRVWSLDELSELPAEG